MLFQPLSIRPPLPRWIAQATLSIPAVFTLNALAADAIPWTEGTQVQSAPAASPTAPNPPKEVFNQEDIPPVQIADIDFIGLSAFSSSALKDEMQLKTGGLLSWITKNNIPSSQKLTADLNRIRSFYLNRGYLDFAIVSTQASLSSDKKNLSLTIRVREGRPYLVKNVRLSGKLTDEQADLNRLITLKTGATYSAAQLNESRKAIIDALGSAGYAYASVLPQTELLRDSGEVDVAFVIDPGRQINVRRITTSGNEQTKDVVIRREIRQLESAGFDKEKIEQSKKRLEGLGFFSEVDISTRRVPGTADQVDLNVNVTEKPTDLITLGAGVSSSEKVIVSAGINQTNAFGMGTSVGLNMYLGQINQNLTLSHYDPYFTESGISRYTDLYYRSTKPLYYVGDADYRIKSVGTTYRLGVPVSHADQVYFGVGAECYQIQSSVNTPYPYLGYMQKYGSPFPGYPATLNTYNIPLTMAWSRDDRDSALTPSSGSFKQLFAELGTPLGNMTFYRLFGQYQQYFTLARTHIVSFNGEVGWSQAYGQYPFPITKNYFVGGIGSVRGYAPGSLGPQYFNQYTDGLQATGGQSKIVANAEYSWPLPGMGLDQPFRLFSFIDAGNVFENNMTLALRYSVGLGFSWISPMGPLKFSYGVPLQQRPSDNTQRFQFQVGTAF